jgi:hypothetical protein
MVPSHALILGIPLGVKSDTYDTYPIQYAIPRYSALGRSDPSSVVTLALLCELPLHPSIHHPHPPPKAASEIFLVLSLVMK